MLAKPKMVRWCVWVRAKDVRRWAVGMEMFFATPAFLQECSSAMAKPLATNLDQLRCIYISGDPCPPSPPCTPCIYSIAYIDVLNGKRQLMLWSQGVYVTPVPLAVSAVCDFHALINLIGCLACSNCFECGRGSAVFFLVCVEVIQRLVEPVLEVEGVEQRTLHERTWKKRKRRRRRQQLCNEGANERWVDSFWRLLYFNWFFGILGLGYGEFHQIEQPCSSDRVYRYFFH